MSDTDKYKLDEALETIKHYQKWRRGDEELEQPHPQAIGHALDKLIALADAVLGEPSKGMVLMGAEGLDNVFCLDDFDSDFCAQMVDATYKAMRDQMLNEINQADSPSCTKRPDRI